MSKTSITRYHDICAGHRVVGHEGKCRHLHGHNYRIHFTCEAENLDDLGRVIDFSIIKDRLCMWLEKNWDHKFLVWEKDPLVSTMHGLINNNDYSLKQEREQFNESLVWLDFNPTAENLAEHLIKVVAPAQLKGTGVTVTQVTIEETRKCAATVTTEQSKPSRGLMPFMD